MIVNVVTGAARHPILPLLLSLLAGCGPHRPPLRAAPATQPAPSLLTRIDDSLAASRAYLLSRQSPDGAWRSGVYGFFKDGSSLTPHVLLAVCGLWGPGKSAEPIERGTDYLAALIAADGTGSADPDLIYPVYTAAEASQCLAAARQTPARIQARLAWLALLRRHQLAEPLGWHPADLDYGGWGYAQQPPIKRPPGAFHGPFDASNLSATLDALLALRAAGLEADDPICTHALSFVLRCQNFNESTPRSESPDGGFYFGPTAAMRNKAGSSPDDAGLERFNSYGGMTCDGIQALFACGLRPDHPRLIAARHWLEMNFMVEHNPGRFIAANEDLRDATYYYYVRSLSRVMLEFDRRGIAPPGRALDWAAPLAAQLLSRQRPDGSWVNGYTDGREDDPLVATPLAVSALINCRRALADDGLTPGLPGQRRNPAPSAGFLP